MSNFIKYTFIFFIIYYLAFITFICGMFFRGNYHFKKFLKNVKNKNILLIGNGPSALKNKKKNIDKKYDVIIRFNNFTTKKYEEYIGSKTDYVFTAGRLPSEKFIFKSFSFFSLFHIFTYPIVYLVYKLCPIKHFDLNLYIFNLKKNYFLLSIFETNSLTNFTTGFSIIKILLDNRIKFDYTGFDSLSDNKDNELNYCHYFKDDHEIIYYINKLHDSKLEKQLFKSHKNLRYSRNIS